MFRNLFILLSFILISLEVVMAQEDTYVTIISSGTGNSESQAINSALRNCIEKTFGVFVSSSTEISGDDIVRDKISTIGQGSIVDYEIITSSSGGDGINVTVSAQVSPTKIVALTQAKGYDLEIKGNVYVQNTIKEEYYKKQEIDIIASFLEKYEDVSFFDFEISVSEPFRLTSETILWDDKLKNEAKKKMKQNHYDVVSELLSKYKVDNEDYSGKNPKWVNLTNPNWYGYWYNKYPDWKITRSKSSYRSLEEAICRKNNCFFKESDFRIDVSFIPSPNKNYNIFLQDFWKLINAVKVKDIDSFEQLVGPVSYLYNGNPKLGSMSKGKKLSLKEGLSKWEKENNVVIASYDITPTSPPRIAIKTTDGKKKILHYNKVISGTTSFLKSQYALRNNNSIDLIRDFFSHVLLKSTSFDFLSSETINGLDRRKYISVINKGHLDFPKTKALDDLLEKNKEYIMSMNSSKSKTARELALEKWKKAAEKEKNKNASRYKYKSTRKSEKYTFYPYVRIESSYAYTFPQSRLFIYLTMDELSNIKELKFLK